MNFAPLQNASAALTRSADRYQKALEKMTANGELRINPAALQALNAKLMQSEHKLSSPQGLPGRPWFQHLIYAPGAYTGYGVKTIPGVREAIEQKKWKEADEQIVRVANALQDEAALVDRIRPGTGEVPVALKNAAGTACIMYTWAIAKLRSMCGHVRITRPSTHCHPE